MHARSGCQKVFRLGKLGFRPRLQQKGLSNAISCKPHMSLPGYVWPLRTGGAHNQEQVRAPFQGYGSGAVTNCIGPSTLSFQKHQTLTESTVQQLQQTPSIGERSSATMQSTPNGPVLHVLFSREAALSRSENGPMSKQDSQFSRWLAVGISIGASKVVHWFMKLDMFHVATSTS